MTQEQHINELLCELAERNSELKKARGYAWKCEKDRNTTLERLKEYAEYKWGEKVLLVNDAGMTIVAYVSHVGIHEDSGKIFYRYNRAKKDGTMSSRRLDSYANDFLDGFNVKKLQDAINEYNRINDGN